MFIRSFMLHASSFVQTSNLWRYGINIFSMVWCHLDWSRSFFYIFRASGQAGLANVNKTFLYVKNQFKTLILHFLHVMCFVHQVLPVCICLWLRLVAPFAHLKICKTFLSNSPNHKLLFDYNQWFGRSSKNIFAKALNIFKDIASWCKN